MVRVRFHRYVSYAVYLLSLTSMGTFTGRLGFYAVLGLIAAITTNVSYWNWYGFPVTHTAAYTFTEWMGYICAGLVAGNEGWRTQNRSRIALSPPG